MDNLAGGAGNDTFSGVIANSGAANTTGTTFQAGDAVVGGAGTDALNISVSGGTAGTNAAVTMTGIERVMVNNVNGTTQSISMALADSSLTTVGHSASNDLSVTTFTGLNKIVGAELSNGSAGITLTYNSSVVAGTADSETLTLSNQTAGTFTSDGIETLNVVSNTLANTITLGSSHTTVNASGAANLNIGSVPASVNTLNASALTGNLTATLSSNVAQVVTGGAGNDVITAGTNLTGTGAGVNAGAGTDTLVTTAGTVIAAAADGARYTGFETWNNTRVAATSTAFTQDASLVGGITTLGSTVTDGTAAGGANASSITYSNVLGTTNTMNVSGLATAEGAAAAAELTVTIAETRLTNTAADAMTINLGTATAGSGTTGVAASAGVDILLNLTTSNEESLTINSQGGANFVTTLDDAALTSLTLTGSQALTIAAISNNTLTTAINAGAMTANFTMGTNAGTTASTITGGAGNDSLVGGTRADAINGGAGADTIVGGAGVDNLSGGDGNDTFQVVTVSDFTDAIVAETVSGGAGNDTLAFATAGNAAITLTAANLGAISGVENLTLNAGSGASSVTLADAVFTSNGQSLAITSGGTGTLTVNASALTGTNSIDVTGTAGAVNDTLTGGAGADTFRFSASTLSSTDSVTGGAGTDTIILATAGGDVVADLTLVRTVENVTTTGTGGNVTMTVGASTIATTGTLTTNASSVTSTAVGLNYTGSAVATATMVQNITGTSGVDTIVAGSGNDIVVSGDGNDTITGGAGIDNLNAGAGNDTFYATSADFAGLTAAETVIGGAGNDNLNITNTTTAATIAASDLAAISGVENITFNNTSGNISLTLTDAVYTANGAATLTVNAAAATTGTVAVSGSALTAANALVVLADLDGTTLAAGSTILGGAGADIVQLDVADLASVSTITGGTGTDTLRIDATGTATMVAGITGFETMTFTTAAATPNITTVDANVASGVNFTVNGSNLTGALTFNGSAETNGTFSITGGTGADVLTGGAGNDTITASAGDDTITGGLGIDVLTGGVGADVFTYTAVAQSSGANIDSVTDWTSGTDKLAITLDYSTNTSAGIVVNTNRATTTAITSTSAAQDALTGDRGQWVYDTSTSQVYVNVNSDNLITASDYRIGLNAGTTAGNTVVNGDINFVINGGSGADSITGGAGADTISGGAGNNVYYYNTGDAPTGESITGGANTDTLIVTTSTTFVGATFGAAGTVLTSASVDNIVITSGQTATFTGAQLTGQAINVNATAAAAANLVITASDANADFTNLTFTQSGGANAFDTGVDTVVINMLSTTAGRSITGTTLADSITGGSLADVIIGGTGADTIVGGEGADTITIGVGADTVSLTEVTAAADTLVWSTAFAAGSANAAAVTGFAFGAGADLIDINVALQNTSEATTAAGTGATNTIAAIAVTAVVNNASAADGGTAVVFTFNGANDLLAAGTTAATAVANAVTALTSGADFGANLATGNSLILQMNDGTNTFVFHYLADATPATTTAADLALIGVFNGTTTALVGDFI